MTDLDWPPVAPDTTAIEHRARTHRHDYHRQADSTWQCFGHAEPVIRDETLARRGKQSRNYGNRAELAVARTYGGTKIGHAGGPVDVRGTDWNTQVKTHRRKPPAEWVKAFGAMSANLERMPRLLLRFVGTGPPDDYFVVRGSDWLAWHGKDGDR